MSATLNLIGLVTLLVMSAALLNNAGIPISSYAQSVIGYVTSSLPVHLPSSL